MKNVEKIKKQMLLNIEVQLKSCKKHMKNREYDIANSLYAMAFENAWMYGWITDDWSIYEKLVKDEL